MNPKKHGSELVAGEPTREIMGAAFEVVNELGHGLQEKPYENALVHQMGWRSISLEQQKNYRIDYKGAGVGRYIPDLIGEDQVIVDAKVIGRITAHERGQLIN